MHTYYNTKFTFNVLAVIGLLLYLSGCGVELVATTAVQAELQAQNAKAAARQLETVKKQVNDLTFDRAVQSYRAEHGENPPSLDALVPKYLPTLPQQADGSLYAYDPATGTLTVPTVSVDYMTDKRKVEEIKGAIQRYGMAVGFYPGTLDDLYPQYLDELPRTVSGEAFVYNNQNGDVLLPGEAANVQHAQQHVPQSGGMPARQSSGGMGIQSGLGNGSTAGATAARSHLNNNVQSISQQSSDRQSQVMDQLGL